MSVKWNNGSMAYGWRSQTQPLFGWYASVFLAEENSVSSWLLQFCFLRKFKFLFLLTGVFFLLDFSQKHKRYLRVCSRSTDTIQHPEFALVWLIVFVIFCFFDAFSPAYKLRVKSRFVVLIFFENHIFYFLFRCNIWFLTGSFLVMYIF